jgi:uncharacterized membrane protein YbhN (UPF0104 family)
VSGLFDAARAFFDGLGSIGWGALAIAVGCHLLKSVARTRAWRNTIAAAYPEATVRWRTVLGAYLAGVGVNSILPARGGDALKLYLVRHRVEGATYPTLAATLLVEMIFDVAMATALLVWALSLGVLPGVDVLPSLPAIDWLWLFRYPRAATAVIVAALVLSFVLGVWASRHIAAFKERVAQGFAIVRTPGLYLRRVVAWQALDWVLRIVTIGFFLEAFGIDTGVRNALLVQVTQSLATIVPLTPGGIGTEQALLVYVLRGEATGSALLGFSVGMKATLLVVNLAVGSLAIAVMLRTLRWRRHVESDKSTARART